ncbi:MAG: DUF1810 family protein, partial [Proteobacteria bacterium]|nr:DUF1810 family protein [Pseudomonadota bacterium]
MQNIILLDWAKPQGQTTMVDGKQYGGDILNNGKRIGHGYTKQIIGERKGDTIFLLGANDWHMADRSAGGGGQAAETGGNYNVMPIDIMPGKDSRQYRNTLKGIVTKFVKNGGKVVVPCQTITAFKKESWWKDCPATHLQTEIEAYIKKHRKKDGDLIVNIGGGIGGGVTKPESWTFAQDFVGELQKVAVKQNADAKNAMVEFHKEMGALEKDQIPQKKPVVQNPQQQPPVQPNIHDIQQFINAHADGNGDGENFATALKALKAEKKNTHWSWYVFPIMHDLRTSDVSKKYAIQNEEHAKAFLSNQTLHANYNKAVKTVYKHIKNEKSGDGIKLKIGQIMGDIDAKKFISSVTLFGPVAKELAKDKESSSVITECYDFLQKRKVLYKNANTPLDDITIPQSKKEVGQSSAKPTPKDDLVKKA